MVRSSRHITTVQESPEILDGRLKALEWAKKNLDGFRPPARKIVTPEEVAAARARAYAWAEQNGLISSAPEYDRDEDESAGDDVPRRRSGFGPPITSSPLMAPDFPIPSAPPGPYETTFRGRAGTWSAEF
jgi:hypothetical protein